MATPKVTCIVPVPREDRHHTDYALPRSFSAGQIGQIRKVLPSSFELEEAGAQLICRADTPDCIVGNSSPILSTLRLHFLEEPRNAGFTAVVHDVRKVPGGGFRVSLAFLGQPHPHDMMYAGSLLSRIEGVSDQAAYTSSHTITFRADGSPERSMGALLHRMQQVRIGAALLS